MYRKISSDRVYFFFCNFVTKNNFYIISMNEMKVNLKFSFVGTTIVCNLRSLLPIITYKVKHKAKKEKKKEKTQK